MIEVNGKNSQKIRELYEKNYNLNQICDELKLPRHARKNISQMLRQSGVQMRRYTGKHTIDTSYFKNIDNKEKAYFLGFIFADGCIYKSSQNAWGMNFYIVEKDKYIVEELKEKCKATYPIRMVKKEKPTHQNKIGMSITNTEFVNNLRNLGCTENKSSQGIIPNCILHNEAFLPSFINGLFDGDGSIVRSHAYYTYPCVSLCLNSYMAEQIKEIIEKIINKTPKIIIDNNICKIQLHKQQAMQFMNWMYKDSNLHLQRKYERYQFFKNYYENIVSPKIARPLRTSLWNKQFVD